MIERLMDLEHLCCGPEHVEMSKQLAQLKQKLSERLDREGKELLERISDAYLNQNNDLLECVFSDGFCAAVGLMLDYLTHKKT